MLSLLYVVAKITAFNCNSAACFILPPQTQLLHRQSFGWPEYCLENFDDTDPGYAALLIKDGTLQILMGDHIRPCKVPTS